MATGILAVCMALTLAQNPGDVRYANFRSLRVPVNVPPALQPEIRELLLFASSDRGREWKQVAGPITPDKKEFAFYAPGDGLYWLRVVKVNQNGLRNPDDATLMRGPPEMKLIIDTLKPIVRSLEAQRDGDNVYVNWDIQEDNPDLGRDGIRLEYQVREAPPDHWSPIVMTPALKGQAQFNPGHKRPLVIRLTVRDLAGNQSFGIKEVAGALAQAGGSLLPEGGAAVLPTQLLLPSQEPERKQLPMAAPTNVGPPPPEFPVPGGVVVPPPSGNGHEKVDPRFPTVAPLKMTPPPERERPQASPGGLALPGGGLVPPPGGLVPPVGGVAPPLKEFLPEGKPVPTVSAPRRPLPPIQFVNRHEVMLEYELKRVGPSGIGKIELWLTRNDGETWEPYAEDPDVPADAAHHRHKRTFDLRDAGNRPFADGIYGLTLVVKNRAGAGKTPRPGDVPEIRIEIDTKPPDAKLYPPSADPQNPDQVLLRWIATDANLTEHPISLDYAERRDGPWQPIAADLENTGRFSWKLGPNVPVQVYLRIRARDKAGNEFVGVTEQPQYIDFTEPEGSLIGVLR